MKKNILKYAVDNGMIDLSYVQEQIEMKKRKELLEKHPHKIWQGKDGEWYTKLIAEDGTKKLRHRKTKDELENVIIEHIQKVIDCPTISTIFNEWVNIRLDRGEIERSTHSRYFMFQKQRRYIRIKKGELIMT